ncbi:DUF4391 domain-containing protein [Methylovulum psychrotolerans]|uniref:DUF4391 domain-containing protein n=1 Tax=Methylovulum psychrotolerans TaxID=1704499 RepID=A0A2S5CFZ2_9GAMM|nr:DUF4391 domain-containing protein [Methylovulum psychrotolerans]POZ49724.1 hypothetical protein AADEFJLK_04484 [Methylovulum psychrotolerans]
MIFAPVIDAFALPPDARVDQRVPKKLLLDQGVPTAADKRQIQDGIEDLHWIAALKPTNIGVPDYRDEVREYLEIAVLIVAFRQAAKPARLIELIHRAIPYPVVLLSGQSGKVSLSMAHKRWSQGEAGKVVIEDLHRTAAINPNALAEPETLFLSSLALSTLPAADLFALYQAWIDRLAGLEAASITGSFTPPTSTERSTILRDGLAKYARIHYELTTLRNQAVKEKQLNRRVELNITIKRLEAELAEIKTTL